MPEGRGPNNRLLSYPGELGESDAGLLEQTGSVDATTDMLTGIFAVFDAGEYKTPAAGGSLVLAGVSARNLYGQNFFPALPTAPSVHQKGSKAPFVKRGFIMVRAQPGEVPDQYGPFYISRETNFLGYVTKLATAGNLVVPNGYATITQTDGVGLCEVHLNGGYFITTTATL